MIGPSRFAGAGMRSRASGAASLDASFCCFCERALPRSELRLFPCPVFPFALSLDVPSRIAQERVSTGDLRSIRCFSANAVVGQAFVPPSTVRFAPVMYEDSGLATNATNAATSSTCP